MLVEFPEDLETTFGVVKQRRSLVLAVIRAMTFIDGLPDPGSAPGEVVALAQAVRRLAN
ncbi:MAG TPA: hypothetical protein VFX16_14310 [Pseudonocardiaceae bacterium]|nr:hypothetical protein [Pseudonocardiaceae bacterium]